MGAGEPNSVPMLVWQALCRPSYMFSPPNIINLISTTAESVPTQLCYLPLPRWDTCVPILAFVGINCAPLNTHRIGDGAIMIVAYVGHPAKTTVGKADFIFKSLACHWVVAHAFNPSTREAEAGTYL